MKPTDPKYSFFTDKIRAAAQKYGIPPALGIWQLWYESNYKSDAVSSAGAIGIAQFMPATAQQYRVDPYDVDSSIDGWGRYMRDLYKMFGSWELALAGYNAGPGNVQKYKGVPPFRETLEYIKKILPKIGKKKNLLGLLMGLTLVTIATIKLSNNAKNSKK